jgi:hypothetical protein
VKLWMPRGSQEPHKCLFFHTGEYDHGRVEVCRCGARRHVGRDMISEKEEVSKKLRSCVNRAARWRRKTETLRNTLADYQSTVERAVRRIHAEFQCDAVDEESITDILQELLDHEINFAEDKPSTQSRPSS